MTLLVEVIRLFVEILLWFMLGRVVLNLLSGRRQTFFTELFEKMTFPAYWVVRRLTPRSVADFHIPILSLPLLFTLLLLLRPAS